MSILIIGGRGFIGSYLRQELINKESNFFISSSSQNKGFIKLNITNKEDFKNIPKDVKVIFNFGSFIPLDNNIENAEKCLEVNSIGLLNILEFCRKRDIKLVNSSSASVYGNPIKFPVKEDDIINPMSYYSISKRVGESYCEMFRNRYGLKCISLRYSSVYGPCQRDNTVLPFFIKNVKQNKDLTVFGNGNRFQDFVYVKDIVNANINALKSNNLGVYNIGSGEATKMIDLANLIIKKFSDNNLKVLFDNHKIDKSPSMVLDISKAEECLGYNVKYNLEEGLENYKKNGKIS